MLKSKSLKEIQSWLESQDVTSDLIKLLECDSRKSVQNLAKRINKKLLDLEKANNKFEMMNQYEMHGISNGFEWIAGIDEAGRGPLAGPVVAAAVILPRDFKIIGLDDSKKLSESKRNELFDIINEKALSVGVGIVNHQRIDEINILNASKEAMLIAVDKLVRAPDLLLIDAVKLETDIHQMNIIKGDQKSNSIAAASIIAKVTRDRMMVAFDEMYPGYHFTQHKGYGTQLHYKSIHEIGISPIHRKTFLKNLKGW